MNSSPSPTVRLLDQSQLGQDCWHSLLISLLRGAAAIQVAAAHLRAEFFPGLRTLEHPTLWYQALAFLTGFSHQAVIVFFVISGWLVGGSLLNKLGQPQALTLYAIDRVTRLWTVLIPTFVLMLAFAIISGEIDPRRPDLTSTSDFSALSMIGNLIGLQTVTLPRFGGNYPLWSLSNETWYYLMFPLLVLGLTARGAWRRALPALALVALALLLPTPLVLYFSIWLMGAAFSRVRLNLNGPARLALLAVLGATAIYFRLTSNTDGELDESMSQDLLLSLLLLLILSSSMMPLRRGSRALALLEKAAQFFSNFSFTLYVVHVPVLFLLGYLGMVWFGQRELGAEQPQDLAIYLAMLGLLLAFSYGFYRLFEARTFAVRRVVKNLLLGSSPLAARAAPAKH